jgi:hypothetical protein
MASKASLENALRTEVMEVIINALCDHFDLDPDKQIEVVGSGEIAIPVVDAEGNDKYPKIKVSIPRGTRNGEGGYIPYDGHEAAVAYKEERESKAQERAVKKAMKEAERGKRKSEDEGE